MGNREDTINLFGYSPTTVQTGPYTRGVPLHVTSEGHLVVEESKETLISNIDEVSASITYIGKAIQGSADGASVWQIKKIEKTGNVTKIRFAPNYVSFGDEWDERASLVYS